MDQQEFPSNSRKEKTESEKNVQRVTVGDASLRRPPLGKRLARTFIAEDVSSVSRYILLEVLIPAAKDLILDVGREGLERMLFGGRSSGRRSGYRSQPQNGYVSYNRYSSGSSNPPWRRDEPQTSMSNRARRQHDFDEILLPTRTDANQVLDSMYELLSKYNQVTVADLYDLVGIDGKFTDDSWGWTRLDGSKAVRVNNGYILDLPKPEQID